MAATKRLPDLVIDTKLRVEIHKDYTHYFTVERGGRRRWRKETWRRTRCLGEGATGKVWLEECNEDKKDGELRADKVIPKRGQTDYYHELEAIAKFPQDTSKYEGLFVRSLGWYENDRSVFIVMEHMKYGSLGSHLSQPLPEDEVKHITLVLEGLASLHENEFVHRDLKPDMSEALLSWGHKLTYTENILVASKGPRWWVKISDFGFSKRIIEGSSLKSTVGTQNYFAPEILGLNTATIDSQAIKSRYTCAVDMWSLGVTVFYMLCHAYLFKNRELLAYTQGAPFPTAALSLHHVARKGQAFIKALLTVDASGRLPAKAALADQWFTGLKEDPRAMEEVSFSGVVEAPVLSFTTASSRSWPMDSTVQTLMSELTISEPLNVHRRKRSPASRGNRDEKIFDTPRALHTEGADFLIRNEFKKAENLLRQAVGGREIALGPNHKDTLDSKLNLGRAYNGLSRYADAHKLLPQVVKGYGESLGPLHKDTLEARYELCDALCGLEEYQEAQDNLQDLIRIRVAISGEEDDFDIYLFDLASEIYYRRENYSDAANMYMRLLSLVWKICGPDDSMIPPILEDLGRCRYYEQRYEEAEAIFQELVENETRTERTEEQALENYSLAC